MKNSFFDTELWKWLRTLIQIIGIILAVLFILYMGRMLQWTLASAEAEENVAYAICVKDDVVNVRSSPKARGEWIGYLNPGDMVRMDGKKQNGYVHCIDMNTESGDGWVFAGYLVDDKPELMDCPAVIVSNGRLAARKYVDGKRTRWLKPNATVHIYYMSEKWCSTDCGYVQTKYLKPEEE